MSDRLAVRACRINRDRMTAQLRADAGGRFLREDALASEIAMMLRPWRDLDHAELVLTAEHGPNAIVSLALRYERARRRAFPIGGNEAADAPGCIATSRPGAPLSVGG